MSTLLPSCKLTGNSIFKQDIKCMNVLKEKQHNERLNDSLKEEIARLEGRLDSIKTELLQKMVVLLNEKQRKYQSELEFQRSEAQGNTVASSSEGVKSEKKRNVKKEPSAVMTKMLSQTSSTLEVDGDDVLSFLDSPCRRASREKKTSNDKTIESDALKVEDIEEEKEEKRTFIASKDKKTRRNNMNLIPSSSSEDEEYGIDAANAKRQKSEP